MLPGQMINMSCYELVVIYDKEYGEVIAYESDAIMNDSNDIVTEAVRLELMEEEYRDRVRWAHCVSEYEYEYIKEGGRMRERVFLHEGRNCRTVR